MAASEQQHLDLLKSSVSEDWAFDAFLPAFREALIERAGLPNGATHIPIARLTLAAFDGIPVDHQNPEGHAEPAVSLWHADDCTDRALLEGMLKVLRRDYPEAELGCPGDQRLSVHRAGLRLLAEAAPDTWRHLNHVVTAVVLLDGVRPTSFSKANLFGFLFFRAGKELNERDVATILVHELAHHELFMLNTLDRFFADDSLQQMVFSPLQQKPRPPVGRLHSAHAIYRMLQFSRRAGLTFSAGLAADLRDTLATFKDTGTTPFGHFLLNDLYPAALHD